MAEPMAPRIAEEIVRLPAPLQREVQLAWEHFQATALDFQAQAAELTRLWACSQFCAEQCRRDPQGLQALLEAGELTRTYAPGELEARVTQSLRDTEDEAEMMRRLRRLRQHEYLRIAWRDIVMAQPVEQVLAELTEVAEACIRAALSWLEATMGVQWGIPRGEDGQPQALVVLAMGKLGGRELNFSSDVDLIFAYPQAGQTDAPRPIENERFFLRLAQRLIKALHEPTADGFVYRVDTRLRPFGDSGPLVLSFSALETYYERHGREWERYALIKARPISGDPQAGAQLMQRLLPFVYRRYLDFGVFESLREMKTLIAQQVQRKGWADNIKLGPGGIREIEFIVQLFQLIRGGQERELRERSLLPLLNRLGARGELSPQAAARLSEAYCFLRRLENRLQQVADRQTHELPRDPLEQTRIAYGMGYADWTQLRHEVDRHRQQVHAEFTQIFSAPQAETGDDDLHDELALVWSGELPAAEAGAILVKMGYRLAAGAQEALHALRTSVLYQALTDTARRRLDHLMPLLLAQVGQTDAADLALPRVLRIVEATARRSTYLSLLSEHPQALSNLVRLCAASPWLSEYLAQHPILLDELLDMASLQASPDRAALHEELSRMLADAEDLEAQMDVLRRFHQINELRIAAADLLGGLPLMRVSDRLTELAEVIVQAVLQLAYAQLLPRYGRPTCVVEGERRPAQFAIIAYGKLAGLELGYGSDLDLIFLHDSGGQDQHTEGPQVLENGVFFARLVQRIIHLLTTRTAAGMLYEVDTRLRPSGRAGLLVTSIDGFADYQRHHAWTWEHQALVRARPVAGDAELGEQFTAVRNVVLAQPRDSRQLRAQVREMRERMRASLDRSNAQQFDLKHGPGGITDIEFMVQYSVLRWACAQPDLLIYTDDIRLLETLARLGLWPQEQAQRLIEIYRTLRARIHAQSLQAQPALVAADVLAAERDYVTEQWRRLMADDADD